MSRIRFSWIVVAAVVFFVASQIANAQPGEGRRGRGGRFGGGFGPASSLRLASLEGVQKALNLSEEQKSKLETINDTFRDDFRTLLEEGSDRDEMQKLTDDAAKQISDVLDDEQEKRLRGITIQVMGAPAVLADAALAKELNVTDEQKTKLEKAQQDSMRAMADAFREIRDSGASREESREKVDKLRDESRAKLLAVLTSEQQQQLKTMEGDKVEIDISQLRGPGGRGGFDGRRGRGDGERRGGRGRDRNNNDADDSSSGSN